MNENVYTPQTKQPPIDDSGLIDIAEKRKKDIEHKRASFNKVFKILKVAAMLTILAGVGLYFYVNYTKVSPPPYTISTPPPAAEPVKEPNGTDLTTWTLYKNDEIKLFVRHPSEAKVIETQSPATKTDIVYDKNNPAPVDGSEAMLGEGYIFRITPLNVGIRDIDSITQIKTESFKVKCPATAVFSQPQKTLVDTVDARTFEITNCNADYVIYYVPRFGIYYEIAQIYKGDLGYKQKYRAILEEMLRTFKFFPENTVEVGPFKTFIDEKNKIIFTHANLDETCCESPAPPIENVSVVVQLGDLDTVKDANTFDGFGVFIQNFNFRQQSFDQLIEEQRRLLREDYKVVTGTDAVTQDLSVKVGKYTGIMLKGYSWRGNDLVYVELAGQYGTRVLVFSIKNTTGAEFEQKVMDTLSSFESY